MNPDGVFVVLPQAREDLERIALFMGAYKPENAVQFVEAARKTFDELAASPFLGSPQPFSDPAHHSLRRWPIHRFRAYLIFYRPFASRDGVEIWRVLHSSQDVTPALEEVTESD